MNFDLADEQLMLADAAERYLADRYDDAAAWRGDGSPSAWRDFASMGWLGMTLPEDRGGVAGGAVETMVLCEAFGHALVTEPYLATILLGAGVLIREAGAHAERLLGGVIGGTTQLALACLEPQSRFDLNDVATTATRNASGWILRGIKAPALNAPHADAIIVSARTAGTRRDGDGISLFVVPRGTPGLHLRPFRTQDGLSIGDLRLDDVTLGDAALLGRADHALPIIESAHEDAAFAASAMAVGAGSRALSMTVEYLQVREQFGRKLSTFQALQHRLVDMHVALEELRSLVLAAAATPAGDREAWRRAVAAAQIQASVSGKLIGQEAVQMHGGIGMTAEYAVGRCYKRLLGCATLFGDADYHLGRYPLALATH